MNTTIHGYIVENVKAYHGDILAEISPTVEDHLSQDFLHKPGVRTAHHPWVTGRKSIPARYGDCERHTIPRSHWADFSDSRKQATTSVG